MKPKTYKTEEIKNESNVIYHKSSIEATLENKPYIVSAVKAAKYSKLDKAKRKEEQKLKKELKSYTQY